MLTCKETMFHERILNVVRVKVLYNVLKTKTVIMKWHYLHHSFIQQFWLTVNIIVCTDNILYLYYLNVLISSCITTIFNLKSYVLTYGYNSCQESTSVKEDTITLDNQTYTHTCNFVYVHHPKRSGLHSSKTKEVKTWLKKR